MGQKSIDEYYSKLNRHFAGCVKRYLNVILFHDETRYLASDTFIMVDIPSDKINKVFSDRKLFPELPEVNMVYTYRSYSVGEVSMRRDTSKDRILDIYNQANQNSHDVIAPTNWIWNFGEKQNCLLFKEVKANDDENKLRTRLIDMAKLDVFRTKDTLNFYRTYRTNLDNEFAPIVIEERDKVIGLVMPAIGIMKDLPLLQVARMAPTAVGEIERAIQILNAVKIGWERVFRD